MAQLRACALERTQFEPLVCAILQLRPPKPAKESRHFSIADEEGVSSNQTHPEWQVLQKHLSEINNRYAGELGNNAYAAFNAVTEFASRPLVNRCIHRDCHGLQRLAGTWLSGFNAACSKPGFSIDGPLHQMENEQQAG